MKSEDHKLEERVIVDDLTTTRQVIGYNLLSDEGRKRIAEIDEMIWLSLAQQILRHVSVQQLQASENPGAILRIAGEEVIQSTLRIVQLFGLYNDQKVSERREQLKRDVESAVRQILEAMKTR